MTDHPLAWYDPTNHHVSTDKHDPLFTPLGQLWPLHKIPSSLTDEQIKQCSYDSTSLEKAALIWWKLKRPIVWSEKDHLENPCINCRNWPESNLAEEVAKMEFKQQMPTKIVGPNLEGVLNAAGVYKKKEWVGLTEDEVAGCWSSSAVSSWRAIEAKLKEKNGE